MKHSRGLFTITSAIVFITLFSCNSDSKKSDSVDKYQETKMSVEDMEKKNPVRFLTVSGKDKHNLIGQTVVKGTITSSAAVVVFKNIDVSISFYSKTGTLLEEDHEIVYEELKPGVSIDFKSKYFAPKGTENVQMKISGAEIAD